MLNLLSEKPLTYPYKYLILDIEELYVLIETKIFDIPENIRVSIKKYLLEHLFVKMDELESYCEETDDYFENYGENINKPIDSPVIIITEGNAEKN